MGLEGEVVGGSVLTIVASTFVYMVRGFFRKSEQQAEVAKQPVNNELVELTNKAMDMFTIANATAVATQDAMRSIASGVELLIAQNKVEHEQITKSNQCIVDSNKEIVNTLDLLNRAITPKIDTALTSIKHLPEAITTLTEQVGMQKKTMNDINDNMSEQGATLGQVLAAIEKMSSDVAQLTQKIDEISNSWEKVVNETNNNLEEVRSQAEKTTQEINVLRGDVVKLQKNASLPEPAPDNQPVLRPTANPIIQPTAKAIPSPGIMPVMLNKDETKTESKDEKENENESS